MNGTPGNDGQRQNRIPTPAIAAARPRGVSATDRAEVSRRFGPHFAGVPRLPDVARQDRRAEAVLFPVLGACLLFGIIYHFTGAMPVAHPPEIARQAGPASTVPQPSTAPGRSTHNRFDGWLGFPGRLSGFARERWRGGWTF